MIVRPFQELSDSGLLWFINTSLFHPRGYALAIVADDDGTVTGWTLLGDGGTLWTFANEDGDLDLHFAAMKKLLP